LTQKKKHVLVLLAVLAIVAVCIYLIYPVQKSTKLGLDLRGGMSVILTAKPTPGAPVNERAMRQAELIIRERIDRLGVTEPQIQRQGGRSILIQLPGIKNPEEALEIIGKPAILQFAIVQPAFERETDERLNQLKKEGKPVLGPILMSGKDLRSAQATYGGQLRTEPIVEMKFTPAGADKFTQITSQNVGRRLAIILDGKIMTAPTIKSAITGGSAIIEGIKSIDEAKKIALVLQTGALPVHLEMAEVTRVGPTLGKESLKAGLVAGLIGLGLVATYMLLYYRGLGLITSFHLTVFAFLFWGIIALLGRYYSWNLTLPGIAGIIVSIGITADSSIIIFERIKEEVKQGKTFRTSVDTGFWRAFRTIFDADLVTWLTAGVLFFVGLGPVKGFALTLALGLMVDMFTALFFTRSILGIIAHTWPVKSPKILGIKGAT
jgi:preprotein translocase subunit SecD